MQSEMQSEPIAQLKFFFERNGHLRFPDPIRREEGHKKYKKGWEVRLVARDAEELQLMRESLAAAKFVVASPFVKGHQIVQPLYGRDAVEEFCRLISHELKTPAAKAPVAKAPVAR